MKQGAIALIGLLTMATIILIFALTANILGVNELQLTQVDRARATILAVADACLEESAIRLKINPAFSNGNLNLENSTCSINITSSGNNRTTTITVTHNQYTKAFEAQFTVTTSGQANNIALTSWKEI